MPIMLHTTPPDPAALARRPDPAGPLAVATPTTRKLADASISLNTRRAYAGALRRLDAWRGAAPVDDASLAVYLGELFEAGRAPATAALAVAAVRFRAKLAGQPAPAGAATARVLGGYRRTAADRGRGQAAPLRADGLAAILATAARPRTDGRGVESHTTAHRRGRLDAVIASLLFMGGLRRSEVSALEWRDVSDARDGDGVLLTVRTSKTNQEGDAADVRYLKNGAANAIRTLRAADADAAPTDRVVGLSPLQIQRRFTAAARSAGIEARVTAHSGRVGLASELTARGASTTEVMLAGNRRDRQTRGRPKVSVKAGTGGRHDSNTASIEPHSGMNSRCRVTGSRTVEPQQHHSTQEPGPSKATGVSSFFWRAASGTSDRSSIRSETSATRCIGGTCTLSARAARRKFGPSFAVRQLCARVVTVLHRPDFGPR